MKILGASLRDDAHLAARGAAVLRLIVGGQDLHLFDRVGIRHADDLSASTSANCWRTVKINYRVLLPRAIHVKRNGGANGEVEVAQGCRAAQSWKQRAHEERVTSIQLLIRDRLSTNLALHRARLCLQNYSAGCDLDCLIY